MMGHGFMGIIFIFLGDREGDVFLPIEQEPSVFGIFVEEYVGMPVAVPECVDDVIVMFARPARLYHV